MARLMINCDLGENEDDSTTRTLLDLVDAANIGCGAHAGSLDKTRRTIHWASEAGVLIGAHPGLATAGGRGGALPTSGEFRDLLEIQVGSFQKAATDLRVQIDYVKLHGSLYHAVEQMDSLSETYLEFLRSQGYSVLCLAGGGFAARAKAAGLRIIREAFADRAYLVDGTLLPRNEAGSLLAPQTALERLKHWRATGTMPTVDGSEYSLQADSLCVHSDSPGARGMLEKIRHIL